MQVESMSGLRRATLRVTCALALACTVPGCITYAVVAEKSTYRELGIASSLGVIEIGGALLAGYAAYDADNPGTDFQSTRAGSMLRDPLVSIA